MSEKSRRLPNEFGFHPAERTSVHLSAYPDRPPILSAWTDTVGFKLSVGKYEVDADHLAFARDLLDAVTEYLAECQRLYDLGTESAEDTAA